MACCAPVKFSFLSQSVTTIPHTQTLKDDYGEYPKIEVFYWDGVAYVAAGIFTLIKMTGTQIIVDHGGPLTGIIKLS